MRLKFRSPFYLAHKSKDVLNLELEIDGHKLYSFKSLDLTPKIREMMLRLSYHQMGLGIRHSDLMAYCEISEERFNAGDHINVGTLLKGLKDYLKSYASEKLCYALAGSVIIVDDEPIDKPTEKYNKIKQDLLKHKEVQAFFLNTAMRLLEDLGAKLNISDTKAYIMSVERMMREEHFLSLVKSGVRRDLWLHST